jgi:hypothetical protein
VPSLNPSPLTIRSQSTPPGRGVDVRQVAQRITRSFQDACDAISRPVDLPASIRISPDRGFESGRQAGL